VYQSRVHKVEKLLWTFGTAFNRVRLIAQWMESASSIFMPAYGPKEDILSSDNMVIE